MNLGSHDGTPNSAGGHGLGEPFHVHADEEIADVEQFCANVFAGGLRASGIKPLAAPMLERHRGALDKLEQPLVALGRQGTEACSIVCFLLDARNEATDNLQLLPRPVEFMRQAIVVDPEAGSITQQSVIVVESGIQEVV